MTQVSAFDRVTARLGEVTGFSPQRVGANWRCPAHPDNNPSLSVTNGDGKVALHCHAGCELAAILVALGLTMTNLFDEALPDALPQVVDRYRYVDEGSDLLFEVVRKTDKTFRQRRPDGHGGWVWKVRDTRRVLYRLPDVLAAQAEGRRVYVAEGEKDADAVTRAGEVGTTNPGGAGKWRREYGEALRGVEVVIVRDRDDAGRAHADQVLAALRGVAGSVEVREPLEGKDVSDHLAAGHTLEDLRTVETEEPVWEPDDSGAPDEPAQQDQPVVIGIESIAVVAARVDATPDPGWLFESVWPADAYGVIAADDKAGKTWVILDAAVSVASGTPWMGQFACANAGPVLVFLGEGGERKMIRRLRAIAQARGLVAEELPIRLCFRVPHLTNADHLAVIRCELDAHPARLAIIDPLYLAARGAKSSDLYEMGAVLEPVQHAVQARKAALQVVTHWNKTGEGRGAKRITGVGPGAWGRVLATAAVEHRQTEPDGTTLVTLDWEFMGDEIPETELRIRRRVWADDPKDLASPLHYEVERLEAVASTPSDGMSPATRRVLAVLEAATTALSVRDIGDDLARDSTGIPLKARTIQSSLKALEAMGQAESEGVLGGAYVWCAHRDESEAGNAL